MKKLLLALSAVCLIPTNTLALIGCNADKASQPQTIKNNINNFLLDSNESDVLKLDRSNIDKLNSFGITYQNGVYQFDNNNLTIEAIKQGMSLLINNDNPLPLIFNSKQTLLDTKAAENETALLVENQDCNIFENNLIYKWNVSFYVVKFENEEFKWVKTNEKAVELYAEIIDKQQIDIDEVIEEELKTEIEEEIKVEDSVNPEVKDEVTDQAGINVETNNKANNEKIAKEYKEIILTLNENSFVFWKEFNSSSTVADLMDKIKTDLSFDYENLDQQVIENSSIKVKNINTQIYLQETDFLLAGKYAVEIEFKIGEEDSQVVETAFFEINISDDIVKDDSKRFECKNRQTFSDNDNVQDPKISSTDQFNDSGIETDFEETGNLYEEEHDIHESTDATELIDSTSTDVKTMTIYVNEKTKVAEVIAKIKQEESSLSQASFTLKDSKNKKVSEKSDIRFTSYKVYQDKKTLVLNIQVEEKILTFNSEEIDSSENDIFNIFEDIKLDKLMAQHCSVKDLKEMIKKTDQFNNLKSKIKNGTILEMRIKDNDKNEIEDSSKLAFGKYDVEILVALKESNAKAIITFEVNVPHLSDEFSSQLSKYVSDIESLTVRITTKKDSTEDKAKCEEKIRNSEEIKNLFKADKKVVIEVIEIQDQAPYTKGTTYKARITFCFAKHENASRQQVEFSFIVE